MRRSLVVAAAIVVAILLNNTSLFAPAGNGTPLLVAHRGLAQTFSTEGLTNETCTATRIDPPRHQFLENTVASMEASFEAGADVVELDIHPTTDGQFAVFHDWTVDCRTNGTGVTREHTLAELKGLDIGYGYTADGGATFPFRGKGVGLMPSLDEVLAAFPGRRLLINVKSNDAAEGVQLAETLARLAPAERARLAVYGGDLPIEEVRSRLPDVQAMSKGSLKRCALRYAAIGWSGYVPEDCRHTIVLLPTNYAWLAWGWPERLVRRLRAAGTDVFLAGVYSRGDAGTSGIDSEAQLQALPAGYDGGIWTNRIDVIGKVVKAAAR